MNIVIVCFYFNFSFDRPHFLPQTSLKLIQFMSTILSFFIILVFCCCCCCYYCGSFTICILCCTLQHLLTIESSFIQYLLCESYSHHHHHHHRGNETFTWRTIDLFTPMTTVTAMAAGNAKPN